ncbi:Universal stress protein UspA and related nucleotide-binding protein [Paramagnetospirillum magnetotacticum MS-1]|uniref:Universal stress protein UspA and related nucleotide-binding protein n=1 Tax=Paramagnetospirillum magnetotacticum MS-1 TaxID=272627 RepID=A0A0C2YRQ6_PARME|nr:universal stress protein [Paramagnetospirillum magnetotacticum]KIL97390.1 Universal stress protein UspA and related nucleotide-binding protein [Paramagnetospirillum magnetotacticum MS-1]
MPTNRVFLVVVDDSPEMQAALRFACRRAKSSDGQVALLRVIEPTEYEHFASIGNLMRAEAREAAEELLNRLAGDVNQMSGHLPVLHVREGNPRDELIALISEEPSISVLVLAADTGPGGPGPLVTALTGKYIGKLRVPLTLVPGSLTPDQIDAIT